jgi:hypothetical protein
MRCGREHLGLGVTLWLALCFPRLHAITFPIPFLEPYTSQQDGERGTVKLASMSEFSLQFFCLRCAEADFCQSFWECS